MRRRGTRGTWHRLEHAPNCWARRSDRERTTFPDVTVTRCGVCGATAISKEPAK